MVDFITDLKSIFGHALAIASPADREAYLIQACAGDAALRAEVEALLEASAGAGHFLKPSPPSPVVTVDESPLTEEPGTLIGPYKLIEQIGEGGMGTVWMAQQTEPVKRVVALKLIKAGMDSKQVIARFEAERQALALMDHPNIAKVLDGGTTNGDPGGVSPGRPYFVMDLVKGVPITRYCDEHHLTPRQRLELFIPVCQAVQHAHQKGIIHRDLKPSNVLVALYDGKPVPKVIDFGVAKAAGQQLTDKTLVTGFGNIVGTLEYMSPEQAEINHLDIDTRSDIYSLGVLLYELLTGSTPFSRKESEKVGMLEMLRVIREQEPTKPSTKLSTAEGLPTLAANRGMEPAKLTKLVRGELDWIVMKALEKDRNRRYETANGFAMDVQRYLADEPVLAGPPSMRYRLTKFLRRNRRPVLAASLLLLTLIGGLIGTTWGMVSTERARRDAVRNQHEAETARERTWEALDEMSSRIVNDWLSRQKTLTAEQKRFLESMLARYVEFTREVGETPEARRALAAACCRVGNIHAMLGRHEEARAAYRQSMERFELLRQEHPGVANFETGLAATHIHLAGLQLKLGQIDDAQASYEAARKLIQPLAPDHTHVPNHTTDLIAIHNDIGIVHLKHGRRDEALASFRTARDLAAALVQKYSAEPTYAYLLAKTHGNIAMVHGEFGQLAEALANWEIVLALRKELVKKNSENDDFQHDLALAHNNLAVVKSDLGRLPDAVKDYEAARDMLSPLMHRYPAVPEYTQDLARALSNMANVQRKMRQLDQALSGLDAAIPLQRSLVLVYSDVHEYVAELARSIYWRAIVLSEKEQLKDSLKSFSEARALLEDLVEKNKNVVRYQVDLGETYRDTGVVYLKANDIPAALAMFDKTIDVLNPIVRARAALTQARETLYLGLDCKAWALANLNQRASALNLYRDALSLAEDLARTHAEVVRYSEYVAKTHFKIGNLQRDLGKLRDAIDSFRSARDADARLPMEHRRDPDYSISLAGAYGELAQLHIQRREHDDALAMYKAEFNVRRDLASRHPQEPYHMAAMASTCNQLGNMQVELKRFNEARASYEEACALQEELVQKHADVPRYAVELGGTYCNIGRLLRIRDETDVSLPWFDKAIARLDPLARKQPPPELARAFLLNSLVHRAGALQTLHRYSLALEDVDRAIALEEGKNPATRLRRAFVLVRLGDHVRAAAAAGELATLNNVSADFTYELGCALALCLSAVEKEPGLAPAERKVLCDSYAAQAVSLLRRAARAEGKYAERLKKSEYFESLRQREEFKALMKQWD